MNLEPRTYVVKWFVPSARNFDRDTTQVIKGLLAIGIVLHHLALHTHTGYPLEFFVYLGRPIVTMFFFISGYGLLSSVMRQGIRYFDTFLSKRFGSLLKPYLVCIVIYQIFSYCIGEFPLSLHQIGQDLRVGNTHSFFPSWFVPVILYLYFSFFVSFHFLSRKTGSGIAVCILLSLVYVAFTKELMNWEM
ncbi:MAG: acyltransferase family protein, partial [Planctomycetaceae bacterium]|nr:acyltransferase family protein [Planctomycetaceae bacterium]